ncbi:MAG: NAD(P)-dependent oxidoreductase [Cryobacterium sp.]|nr:NAD(P)-dependent oxidoreductase [Oligoflexia bacterium]
MAGTMNRNPSVTSVLFYNGATGGLGRYFGEAARVSGVQAIPLHSRLEDERGLSQELASHWANFPVARDVTLVQLAAMVSVPGCEREPEKARKTNVVDSVATVKTFIESAKAAGLEPRVLFCSTGHLYAPKAGKLLETDLLAPRSVYALTKLEAERALESLCAEKNTLLTIARVFGLVAPGQPPFYVLPSLYRRAKEGDLKNVPGLSNTRDYLDSRDVCRVLVELAVTPPGDRILNVCAGEAATIGSILDACLDALHPSDAEKLKLQVTEGQSRPDDIAMIVGDPEKLVKALGRNPKTISIAETIRDLS